MAEELQTEFERLTNQARFIQMIVDKELVISNKKKVDVIAELRKLQFRPFPSEQNFNVNVSHNSTS